jgi:hypothetical protein
MLLCVSAYAVIWVVKRSSEKNDSWWRRNEITVVMSMISFIFPMLFEILGLMEYYHPRMQLRLQLARIMILNLLNLYSLIWALFQKINEMTARLGQIKTSQENNTETAPSTVKVSSTTIKSITESVYSRITEIVNQPVTESTGADRSTLSDDDEAFFAGLITESYDSDNTNYFDPDPTESSSSTVEPSSFEPFLSNFTESFIGENITELFYIDDYANFSLDSNSSEDLFENSNFNMSNLINASVLNSTFPSNFTNLIFNSTNIEPIAAAYQSLQYNHFQHEHSSFINMDHLNASTKLELRKLCWETMFGQELVKLTVMDLVSFNIDIKSK